MGSEKVSADQHIINVLTPFLQGKNVIINCFRCPYYKDVASPHKHTSGTKASIFLRTRLSIHEVKYEKHYCCYLYLEIIALYRF